MSNKELLSHPSTAVEAIGLLIALQWPSGGGCRSRQLFSFDGVIVHSGLVLFRFYLLSRPCLPSHYTEMNSLIAKASGSASLFTSAAAGAMCIPGRAGQEVSVLLLVLVASKTLTNLC